MDKREEVTGAPCPVPGAGGGGVVAPPPVPAHTGAGLASDSDSDSSYGSIYGDDEALAMISDASALDESGAAAPGPEGSETPASPAVEVQSWFAVITSVCQAAGLSQAAQEVFLGSLTEESFEEGQHIVRQGEEGDRFFILVSGTVSVEETPKDGGPNRVLSKLHPGHHFGEYSVMRSQPRLAHVIARSPTVECMVLSRAAYLEACAASPGIEGLMDTFVRETEDRRRLRASVAASGLSLGASSVEFVSTSKRHARETHTIHAYKDSKGHLHWNEYVVQSRLGAGAYGTVYLCKNLSPSPAFRTVAVKVVDKAALRKRRLGLTDAQLMAEAEVMTKLQHKHVVQLLEVINATGEDKLYMVQEFVALGPLMGDSEGQASLSVETVRRSFRDVLRGLEYLHFQRVLHLDIKPSNILMSEEGAKLADFGTAAVVPPEAAPSANSFVGKQPSDFDYDDVLHEPRGTPAFMAPELFQDPCSFSGRAADVYSLGATLFMLVTGSPPIMAANELELAAKHAAGVRPEWPVSLGAHLTDLLQHMLEPDPAKRATLAEVMAHDWTTLEGIYPLPPTRYVRLDAPRPPQRHALKPSKGKLRARPSRSELLAQVGSAADRLRASGAHRPQLDEQREEAELQRLRRRQLRLLRGHNLSSEDMDAMLEQRRVALHASRATATVESIFIAGPESLAGSEDQLDAVRLSCGVDAVDDSGHSSSEVTPRMCAPSAAGHAPSHFPLSPQEVHAFVLSDVSTLDLSLQDASEGSRRVEFKLAPLQSRVQDAVHAAVSWPHASSPAAVTDAGGQERELGSPLSLGAALYGYQEDQRHRLARQSSAHSVLSLLSAAEVLVDTSEDDGGSGNSSSTAKHQQVRAALKHPKAAAAMRRNAPAVALEALGMLLGAPGPAEALWNTATSPRRLLAGSTLHAGARLRRSASAPAMHMFLQGPLQGGRVAHLRAGAAQVLECSPEWGAWAASGAAAERAGGSEQHAAVLRLRKASIECALIQSARRSRVDAASGAAAAGGGALGVLGSGALLRTAGSFRSMASTQGAPSGAASRSTTPGRVDSTSTTTSAAVHVSQHLSTYTVAALTVGLQRCASFHACRQPMVPFHAVRPSRRVVRRRHHLSVTAARDHSGSASGGVLSPASVPEAPPAAAMFEGLSAASVDSGRSLTRKEDFIMVKSGSGTTTEGGTVKKAVIFRAGGAGRLSIATTSGYGLGSGHEGDALSGSAADGGQKSMTRMRSRGRQTLKMRMKPDTSDDFAEASTESDSDSDFSDVVVAAAGSGGVADLDDFQGALDDMLGDAEADIADPDLLPLPDVRLEADSSTASTHSSSDVGVHAPSTSAGGRPTVDTAQTTDTPSAGAASEQLMALSAPESARNSSMGLVVGVAEDPGPRTGMEDRSMVLLDMAEQLGLEGAPETAYFGIFDGHNGDAVAEALAARLHLVLAAQGEFEDEGDMSAALEGAFAELDAEICEQQAQASLQGTASAACAGATACVAVLRWQAVGAGGDLPAAPPTPRMAASEACTPPASAVGGFSFTDCAAGTGVRARGMSMGTASPPPPALAAALRRSQSAATSPVFGRCGRELVLYMANAGDCRAVLSHEGLAVNLTQDHKPKVEAEKARIEAAGGWIANGRLNGVLGVSRAFGDAEHKAPRCQAAWGSEFSSDPLTAAPEVTGVVLCPGDEFLIIASDGLWDVLSSQEAVNFTRRFLVERSQDVQLAAAALVKKAMTLSTVDNTSVAIIGLNQAAQAPLASSGSET